MSSITHIYQCKKTVILLMLLFAVGCARRLEPTVENINKIFASKDFTLEFHTVNEKYASLSFRNDYLVYKTDSSPIYRREITYDEVLLINDFIQNILNLHSEKLNPEKTSYYVIKNTAYKVMIVPDQEDFYFEALIKTLQLHHF